MSELEEILATRFGLPSFRPWQREAVVELLEGSGRVLVVAPTGGGKSLCYQFPAVVLGGTSVVVSPLIALMDDQVRSLGDRGIAATYLASTLDPAELRAREQGLAAGKYQLVYVAPERLRSGWLVSLLTKLAPPLVAIDEAHCISQWGHDFRPDYLRIGDVLRTLRPARVLACTATATPAVRAEILQRLDMPAGDTSVVLRGFARPNLHLGVEEIDGMTARRKLVIARAGELLGSAASPKGGAIIYAGTRRNTERFAEAFVDEGWRCGRYHAGLAASERESVSARFARGALDVVVATNAFGMGIDRPDIRLVAHVQAPGSIEQYYQEVGRAGRDDLPAHGLLLSGVSDYGLRRRLIALGADEMHDPTYLQRQWDMFLDLMRYVEAGSCRHDFILRYFEDEKELLGGCGHCDVCERLEEGQVAARAGDDAEIVVRKALAGVARLKRRAGLTALATSLHGKSTQRVRQLGLDELSTHGILKDHDQAWILSLLRRLMTAALIDVTDGDFPVPYLTSEGVRVMKAAAPARVLLPPPAARSRSKKRDRSAERPKEKTPAAGDATLFEALKSARREQAQTKGVPAYVICHDRTLVDMAARRPRDHHELQQVHGMGPARIDAYGAAFLAVVAQHR
jgi:ATP-dependent DNA helicase RecQ